MKINSFDLCYSCCKYSKVAAYFEVQRLKLKTHRLVAREVLVKLPLESKV